MKLLTKAMKQQLPPLWKTLLEEDPVVYFRVCYRGATWAWYIVAFDQKDLFAAYVDDAFPHVGCFSLAEIGSLRKQARLPLERDGAFHPCRLSELKRTLDR